MESKIFYAGWMLLFMLVQGFGLFGMAATKDEAQQAPDTFIKYVSDIISLKECAEEIPLEKLPLVAHGFRWSDLAIKLLCYKLETSYGADEYSWTMLYMPCEKVERRPVQKILRKCIRAFLGDIYESLRSNTLGVWNESDDCLQPIKSLLKQELLRKHFVPNFERQCIPLLVVCRWLDVKRIRGKNALVCSDAICLAEQDVLNSITTNGLVRFKDSRVYSPFGSKHIIDEKGGALKILEKINEQDRNQNGDALMAGEEESGYKVTKISACTQWGEVKAIDSCSLLDYIVVAYASGAIEVFNGSGKHLFELEKPGVTGRVDAACMLIISIGDIIALYESGMIKSWSSQSIKKTPRIVRNDALMKQLRLISAVESGISFAYFSYLAVGCKDGKIFLIDHVGSSHINTLWEQRLQTNKAVVLLSDLKDGKLAAAYEDGSVIVWDTGIDSPQGELKFPAILKIIKRSDSNALPVALSRTLSGLEITYADGAIDRHLIPEAIGLCEIMSLIKSRKLGDSI